MIGDAILTNNSNPEQHMYNVCIEIHVIYVYIQYFFFFIFIAQIFCRILLNYNLDSTPPTSQTLYKNRRICLFYLYSYTFQTVCRLYL